MSWFDDMISSSWEFIVSIILTVFHVLNIPDWLLDPVLILTKVIILLLLFSLDLLMIVWYERKLIGRFHNRRSVTETGKFGLLQNIADFVKLMIKEDIIPKKADKFLHNLVPALFMFLAMVPLVVIPFGPNLWAANIETSLIFVVAMLSMTPGLILLGGWAGNNKFSAIGAFRSGLQMVAYELPMAIAAMSVVLLTNSLNLVTISTAQQRIWFIALQPIGFLIFLVTSVMALERMPFDLPEAEAEIVAGWKTEFGSLKFGLFMGAEYVHVFVVLSLTTILFLGGWYGPPVIGPLLPPVVWFLIKVHLLFIFYVWVRLSYPRPRLDQLLRIGWKWLFPLALLNLIVTALLYPYLITLI